MPYALRESGTGQLLACMQVNSYQLPYFGVKLWASSPDHAARKEALEAAGVGEVAPSGEESAKKWQPVELTEHQAKLANVKLRNDPRRRVYLQDNVLSVSIMKN